MPGAKLTAIGNYRKRLDASRILQSANSTLSSFALDLTGRMATYPPARPWKGRTPKKGPRRNGRRTGQYGKGWRPSAAVRFSGTAQIDVINRVDYAVYVGGDPDDPPGRRQVPNMRERGWPSVRIEADKLIRTKYRTLMRRAVAPI